MSRSNPSETAVNPATRWFEWNGGAGNVRYYDKLKKETVQVELPFAFVLLDELKAVGGWNDASQSAIYSNEVRNTTQDVLIVKSFKGGVIDEGLYKDIKDHVTSKAVGGQFVANCYIAYKTDDGFAIGSLKFKGAALGAWMDFSKENRGQLYKQAIVIHGFTEGKKGSVKFRTPTLKLNPLSDDTNNIALALDQELQTFLKSYLARAKRDHEAVPADLPADLPREQQPDEVEDNTPMDADEGPITIEDVPFAVLLPLLSLLPLGTLFV